MAAPSTVPLAVDGDLRALEVPNMIESLGKPNYSPPAKQKS